MSSLSIREARENIIRYTNQLPFPLEVKRLMFKEILGQIENASEQEIVVQIKEREESEKEKEKSKSEKSEEVKPDE